MSPYGGILQILHNLQPSESTLLKDFINVCFAHTHRLQLYAAVVNTLEQTLELFDRVAESWATP